MGASVEQSYLFVDGAYFVKAVDAVIKRYYPAATAEIEFAKLARRFQRVFYYGCMPGQNDGESDADYAARCGPTRDEFDALRGLPGVFVREGQVRPGRKKRQKGVDIALAVEMLSHTVRRNMEGVVLLAGDMDFKPLMEAVVREGMRINLWYERTSTSRELRLVPDFAEEISFKTVWWWVTLNRVRWGRDLPGGCRCSRCRACVARGTRARGSTGAGRKALPHRQAIARSHRRKSLED